MWCYREYWPVTLKFRARQEKDILGKEYYMGVVTLYCGRVSDRKVFYIDTVDSLIHGHAN